MPGEELAKNIRPDGTLPFLFDGLRAPVPLPPLAGAILRAIDGRRTVAEIEAVGHRAGRRSGTVPARVAGDLHRAVACEPNPCSRAPLSGGE